MNEPLTASEVAERIARFPEWELMDGRLARSFEFGDFRQAFGFMAQVALWAEKLDHHPDWRNVFGRVDVALETHDVGGLTDLDFRLAGHIDEVFARA